MSEEIQGDFLSYLNQTKENEYKALYDFFLDTLMFSIKVHCYHLKCGKGFYHTQFNEIYDELRDFGDSLAEICLSYTPMTFDDRQYQLHDDGFDIASAIAKIEEYKQSADAISKNYSQNRAITNLFDDMTQKLTGHIGLIKNFS